MIVRIYLYARRTHQNALDVAVRVYVIGSHRRLDAEPALFTEPNSRLHYVRHHRQRHARRLLRAPLLLVPSRQAVVLPQSLLSHALIELRPSRPRSRMQRQRLVILYRQYRNVRVERPKHDRRYAQHRLDPRVRSQYGIQPEYRGYPLLYRPIVRPVPRRTRLEIRIAQHVERTPVRTVALRQWPLLTIEVVDRLYVRRRCRQRKRPRYAVALYRLVLSQPAYVARKRISGLVQPLVYLRLGDRRNVSTRPLPGERP